MGQISLADPLALLAIAMAFAMGGILKGATGAGAPVVAVPVMTALFDVRVAVAVMVLPSLITNLVQIRRYGQHRVAPGFARNMAIGGALGAVVGTYLLASLPASILQLTMAGLIAAYVLLRVVKPAFKLALSTARLLVGSAGFFGGVLQGAVGLSAPVALTFLNAMRLDRGPFIFTVSVFFAAMSGVQVLAQIQFGIMTWEKGLVGIFALIPLLGAMPLGEWLGRRLGPRTFDIAILVFLGLLAIRLIWAEIAG